jgi:hypothetical protein
MTGVNHLLGTAFDVDRPIYLDSNRARSHSVTENLSIGPDRGMADRLNVMARGRATSMVTLGPSSGSYCDTKGVAE